jgi:peptidoglycan L-alanyl-D-glutamate endopeptidase CwlK
LELIADRVVRWWDCHVAFGFRPQHEQNDAYMRGASTKRWPDSLHNRWPSEALDLAPWYSEEAPNEIPWEDVERFRAFGGFVMGVAAQLGIGLSWGGDWDGDWIFTDQRLHDLVHFQLVNARALDASERKAFDRLADSRA